jgi:hypothetical protein
MTVGALLRIYNWTCCPEKKLIIELCRIQNEDTPPRAGESVAPTII